ncbi:hypothetical protein [Micromonospora sp. HK10]|uniref:hypothetical protein n=1 Tax=Micromonospora sp. HK10 TaxID=1538294 RepID=UPI000697BAE2|nr:hypothetical protein [Micromonospora sp. HK10]
MSAPVFPRRPLAALLVVLVGLVGLGVPAAPAALAAPSKPNYPVEVLIRGERLHLPLLMSRYRHTVLTDQDRRPDTWMGYGRNVADGHWTTTAGGRKIDWYLTVPSVNSHDNSSPIALIDIYQFDESTGRWRLVDVNGNQLRDAAGNAVAWDKSSAPSFAWDLSKEADLAADLRNNKLHSEPLIKLFLTRRMAAALGRDDLPQLVDEVGSERMFCSGPAGCVRKLKNEYFPNLQRGKVLTDLPSKSMLGRIARKGSTDEARAAAREKLKNGGHSDAAIEKSVTDWSAKGRPVGVDAPLVLGGKEFGGGTGNAAPTGPAALGAVPAGTDPGGIDFTTLQLRYLSEDERGNLRYAYRASPATRPGQKVSDGQRATAQAADAFYVWLNLPTSTFWVNLNPNEPDRIIDRRLATTDVGRILLEADLDMKRLAARLTDPRTALGLQFWGKPDPKRLRECAVTRQWIVPKPASVYEDNGGLYIVDAPLEVKSEAQVSNGKVGDPACPVPSARMDKVYRKLILPKVEAAVNTSPRFADLRKVYLARVAAEWYRQRHTGALVPMIDSGDVSRWPATRRWTPRQTFDAYVKSYRKGEYKVTKSVVSGRYRYTFTYVDGGVDFADVPFAQLPQPAFQQRYADVSTAVGQSFHTAAPDQHGDVWLGATAQVRPRALDFDAGDDGLPDDAPPPAAERDQTGPGGPIGAVGLAVLGIVLILGALFVAAALAVVVIVVAKRRGRPGPGRASPGGTA